MTEILALATANLLSPPVLFFALGMAAGFLKSDLSFPDAVVKGMSLYLLLSIGFKGGVAAQAHGLAGDFLRAVGVGLGLSLAMPLVVYAVMRGPGRLDRTNAGAVAAHYGSISIVTFVAAMDFAGTAGLAPGKYLAAVAAIMETPGIVAALFLVARGAAAGSGKGPAFSGHLLREVLLNGSVVLLAGAFFVGLLTGAAGMKRLDLFVNGLFGGVLCLFLLELGLTASRRLSGGGRLPTSLIVCGVALPLIGATLGLIAARLCGVGPDDAAVLMTLGASSSYIAAPAAIRIALPEADPGIYLPLSIGVTFPFNIAVGIPLYAGVARALL